MRRIVLPLVLFALSATLTAQVPQSIKGRTGLFSVASSEPQVDGGVLTFRNVTYTFPSTVAVAPSLLLAAQERRPENLSIEVVTEGPQPARLRYTAEKETIEARARTMSIAYSGMVLTVTMTDGSAAFHDFTWEQAVNSTFQRLEFTFDGGSLKRMIGRYSGGSR